MACEAEADPAGLRASVSDVTKAREGRFRDEGPPVTPPVLLVCVWSLDSALLPRSILSESGVS